jgi:hypothetical protein
VVVTTEGHGPGQRLHELLKDAEVPARLTTRPASGRRAAHGRLPRRPASAATCSGRCCLTESDLTGTAGRAARTSASDAQPPQERPSTRCSCAPATPSCTSSTVSPGTSRWCSAPSRRRPAST